ncbi:MAG TPA: 3-isopropylmalate dehydratase large subunit [Steroidobacteraceae bacterium]
MAGRTGFEKLWSAHCISDLGGGAGLILIDRVLLHERTGGVALKSLSAAGRSVLNPQHSFATMDHVIDTFAGRGDRTLMPTGTAFITATRDAAKASGIALFDLGDSRQGIVHVISPEQAIMLPGLTLVCPDSHTCSQGALGGLAWGIGSTETEHALATGTLRVIKPKTMRIKISGRLPRGVTPKDLALHVLGRLGSGAAKGHVLEYSGSAISALDLEGRLTLCNMAAELSAFTALIAPDEKVFDYLHGRPFAPNGSAWEGAVAAWSDLRSDEDAAFDAEFAVNAADVSPMVTWGTSPQQAIAIGEHVPEHDKVALINTREAYERALAYMDVTAGQSLLGLPIDAAFIGSCTNSRLSDLRRAAELLKGRKVASGVKAICVPGSSNVKLSAEAEGIDRIFLDSGFEWREAGCSMCFFAGGESFGLRERVVSSTNRNFESRQGPSTRTHLASPETVAASAIAGHIADPRSIGVQ